MGASCYVFFRYSHSYLYLVVFSIVLNGLVTTASFAQTSLPPAATPGGVQPKDELRTLPVVSEEVFPIPPMIDRPLGIDEGPVVVVQRFELMKYVDRPHRGVILHELEQILETARLSRPEGFTIGRLQEVANQVTRYYRKVGFVLTHAVVPAQDVENGVVVIDILEGRMGEVVPEGNVRYSSERLLLPFHDLVHRIVLNAEMETALLHVTDYPGITMFGVFRPGKQVGETELVLKVQEERIFDVGAVVDNFGSSYTGEWRGRLNADWNNPFGFADRLSASIMQTVDPANGLYGSLAYDYPVSRWIGSSIGVVLSRNQFEVGQEFAALGIEGTTDIATVYLEHNYYRSRTGNLYSRAELSRKRAEILEPNVRSQMDNLSVLNLGFNFDSVDTRWGGGINQGNVSLGHGFSGLLGAMDETGADQSSRTGGSGDKAGGEFNKLKFYLARLQSISKNHSLLLRMQGQYSSDLLTSLEQMSLGGPDSVRAYPTAEHVRDKALYGSLEWIVNAPGFADKQAFADRTWGELLQLSLFVDSAKGWLNDPLGSEEESVSISGIGGAAQFNLPGKLLARLIVATPTGSQEASNERDPQYFFNMSYTF